MFNAVVNFRNTLIEQSATPIVTSERYSVCLTEAEYDLKSVIHLTPASIGKTRSARILQWDKQLEGMT